MVADWSGTLLAWEAELADSDSAHFKNQISKPLAIPPDSTRAETALAESFAQEREALTKRRQFLARGLAELLKRVDDRAAIGELV